MAGTFDKTAMASAEQAGSFLPVAGDFDGDGDDDIYWYQPGGDPIVAERCCNYEPLARRDQLWRSTGTGTFTPSNLSRIATSIPVVGDFDADGADDILWYGPGDAPDEVWVGGALERCRSGPGRADDPRRLPPGARRLRRRRRRRPALVLAGRASTDTLWMFGDDFTYTWSRAVLNGEAYEPFAGDFDGDGTDEVFLYGPGVARDRIITDLRADGSFDLETLTVNGYYQPLVQDFDGNGRDDVLWYR